MEVGKGQPASVQFRESIASAVVGLGEVIHLQDTAKVQIMGLDATVTEEEAKAAINSASDGGAFNFGKIRGAAGGQQSIDVTLARRIMADKLVSEGRLRIGWNQCKVRLKHPSERSQRDVHAVWY